MSAVVLGQDRIELLDARFEKEYPQTILKWAAETYGEKLAIVTSFQPTGIVTIHMMQSIAPQIPIITLDTGLLFQETHDVMNELEQRFDITINRVRPEQTLQQQAEQYGDELWKRDPDRCCNMRKVRPLDDILSGYDAWVTGLRRDQSERRANTPIVSWDNRHNLIKLCPFASWTESMIWTYINAYELPYNKLHDQGFPSIGCQTCTKAVDQGEDPRAGRWSNHLKTECGIHVEENLVSNVAQ